MGAEGQRNKANDLLLSIESIHKIILLKKKLKIDPLSYNCPAQSTVTQEKLIMSLQNSIFLTDLMSSGF